MNPQLIVNSQPVPEQFIMGHEERLRQTPAWKAVADSPEKAANLRSAAESLAVDWTLLQQHASSDPRPLDQTHVDAELEKRKQQGKLRAAFDDSALRREVETQMRVQRVISEVTASAAKPAEDEVLQFYEKNRENFRSVPQVHAAHIVKHVNEAQTESQARAAIEAALADLDSGVSFAEAVERHSDCKGNGGDLGTFQRGVMVEEFEAVVFAMKAGERSGIFRTPFGFHIAEVAENRSGCPASYEDVKPDIERVMTSMSQQEALSGFVKKLRASGAIHRTQAAGR